MGIYVNQIFCESIFFSEEEKEQLKEMKNKVKNKINELRNKNKKGNSLSNNQIYDNKSNQLTEEQYKIAKKEYDRLLQLIPKSISKLKSSSDFKKRCKESCLDYSKRFGFDSIVKNDNFIPKLHCENFEDLDSKYGDAIIEIIDSNQAVRIVFSWILYDIVDILQKDYKDLHFDFDYGDGDEGCLYIQYYL